MEHKTYSTSRQDEADVASGVVGAVRSSEEGSNDAGAKGPYLNKGNEVAKDRMMASHYEKIETPNKVQKLQRTLYRKAKGDRRWKAWSLYSDLCRLDVLETAAKAVLGNNGAPGVDGVRVEEVRNNLEAFLTLLRGELVEKSYRPGAVKRVWIPKADGKLRPLGIPNVKDRIVQMALKLLLEPIFEADFNDGSYGYRPERSAKQAIEAIREELRRGREDVIDADLSGYFDSINHAMLMSLVARRVSDGAILELINRFLKAPVVESKEEGQDNDKGTPQGGVMSPLLANIYLNSLDHGVNGNKELDAKLIRYADDFVILCHSSKAKEILARLKLYLERKKLTLNEEKTKVLNIRTTGFRFLGFEFSIKKGIRSRRKYVHVEPTVKALGRMREKVREILNFRTIHLSCKQQIEAVNRRVRGWFNYYHMFHCSQAFSYQQVWLQQCVSKWLWKKYGRAHNRLSFFDKDRLHGQYGLVRFPSEPTWTR